MINRNTAETLIRQYFQSWLQQDLSLFLSTLSPNIQVVECYGPVYWGTEEVRQWFVDWHTQSGKGKVTKWEIFKILYDEAQNMAAVEWDFESIHAGNVGSFLGASLFHFDETRIERIQEYKMEKEQYRPYGNQHKV
ncbi:MAG TPA: nuclear transport factor 2 family protein [Anaerolineales bacterium]|nr:nuclear transport factor 2 family protein [Anaerolineales bacterium]